MGKISDAASGLMNRHEFWYITALTCSVNFIDGWYSTAPGISNPNIIAELLGGDSAFWAYLLGIAGVANFATIGMGILSDYIGRKKMELLLIWGMFAGGAIMYFAGFSWQVCLLVYMMEYPFYLCNLWSVPLAENVDPKKRGQAQSIANMIGSLIPLSSVLQPYIFNNFGWRAFWVFSLPMCIVATILWIPMKESYVYLRMKKRRAEARARGESAPRFAFRDIIKGEYGKAFIVGTVWMFMWNFVGRSTAWDAYLVRTIYGQSVGFWADLALISTFTTVVGYAATMLSDRIGRKTFFLAWAVGDLFVMTLWGLLPLYWGADVFIWLYPLKRAVHFFILPILFMYPVETMPTHVRGTAAGFANGLGRIAYIVGPMAIGFMFDVLGWNQMNTIGYMYVAMVAPVIIGIILQYVINPPEPARKEVAA